MKWTPEEVLRITREQQSGGTYKHDYYLSNAVAETPLKEFVRVAKVEKRKALCGGVSPEFTRSSSD